MIRQRLLLASLSAVLVGIVLACGGTTDHDGDGGKPKPDGVAARPKKHKESKEEAEARAKAKAQAEADAQAKNEANRKAYEAEVEDLKARHQEKQKQFEADQEAFKKANLAYQAAKAEYEGTRKLAMARGLYDDSQKKAAKGFELEAAKLREFADNRFREIIKLYPDTQAAKDVRILLKGGDVVPRKLPAKPNPPVVPVEPPPLVLPSAPEPVAVVYPSDPEEEARARAAAEAARKAEEEYDVGGLVLLRKTVTGKYDEFAFYVTGTVVNRRSRKLRYAQITFNIYDASGAQVGSALANINGLEPGGQWNFKAVALVGNGRSYKVAELSGF